MNKNQRHHYLKQMGVDIWVPRPCHVQNSQKEENAILHEKLKKEVEACQACSLAKTRTHVVFNTGSIDAEWMIIGEAPGFYEDKEAKPFVGRAGQLLDAMIASIGQKREEVYVANVLKCRPPENRDPLPEEVSQCTPFLIKQIELIAPKMILALGRHAARFLLNTTESISALRGKQHHWRETPVLVSYHPAYLLRNPQEKSKAFVDWLRVKKQLK